MSQVIGVVGPIGSGKDAFGTILSGIMPHQSIKRLRFGDILKEILDTLHIPANRENLTKLSNLLESGLGAGTLTRAMGGRIANNSTEIIILDGVRWHNDVQMLRNLPNNILVAVTVNPRIRWERIKLRKEKKGEEHTTWEQFCEAERAETERHIPDIMKQADFTFDNNGSFAEFREQVANFVRNHLPTVAGALTV